MAVLHTAHTKAYLEDVVQGPTGSHLTHTAAWKYMGVSVHAATFVQWGPH